jgi:hypothetical protein
VALRKEKWKLCRRECVEYIYPFPDVFFAGFAFRGSYSFVDQKGVIEIIMIGRKLFWNLWWSKLLLLSNCVTLLVTGKIN